MPVSLDKVQQDAPELVSLFKQVGVSLEKQGINPANFPAKLIASFDHSGSTNGYGLYRPTKPGSWEQSPTIPQVADLAFIAALKFGVGNDPSMPVSFFDSSVKRLGEVSLKNCRGFLAGKHPSYALGGTSYIQALKGIVADAGYTKAVEGASEHVGFFKRLTGTSSAAGVKASAQVPTLALFVTDGEPQDSQSDIVDYLTKMSHVPIFIQFIGVGGGDFSFLQELDEMDGRFVDNANFFDAKETDGTVEAFIKAMLGEFPDYYQKARALGLIID